MKEFVPVFLAMNFWQHEWSNQVIVFHVDNQSVMHILLGQTSNDPVIMSMLRKMVLIAMSRNIQFTSTHIRGIHNRTADLLSRLQVHKARLHAPFLDLYPQVVNRQWLPWSPPRKT